MASYPSHHPFDWVDEMPSK